MVFVNGTQHDIPNVELIIAQQHDMYNKGTLCGKGDTVQEDQHIYHGQSGGTTCSATESTVQSSSYNNLLYMY